MFSYLEASANQALSLDERASLLPMVYAARYSWVAATLFFGYDTILTLSDEVQYVWNGAWTVPKCLYVLARYYGLFTMVISAVSALTFNPDTKFCRGWLWFSSVNTIAFMNGVINFLLFLRLYALYGRSKLILWTLGALYFVEVGIEVANLAYTPPDPILIQDLSGTLVRGCMNGATAKPTNSAVQAVCLFRAFIYLVLTFGRWPSSRVSGVARRLKSRIGPLMSLFVRDELAVSTDARIAPLCRTARFSTEVLREKM